MRKFKEIAGIQVIYQEATVEDFYARRILQEEIYGPIGVHEDDVYLEFYCPDWKERGLSSKVTLSLVKETGMLHIPFLYSTYQFKDS
ncbi:hypothetical protein VPHD479_0292 [Vibrio phage D479]